MIHKIHRARWIWVDQHNLTSPSLESCYASLVAPWEEPKKRFLLEASIIGDGVEEWAEQIKRLISATPELYYVAELLIEMTENSWYEEDEMLDEIINIRDKFKEIINEINKIEHDK